MRGALLVLPLAGAALLVAAEFSVLYEVRVAAAVPAGGTFRAGPHHGYALGSDRGCGGRDGGDRGARPLARGGAWRCSSSARRRWPWCLLVDLPDVDETGLVGQTYEAARAEARSALWLALAGAGCLVVGAGVILGSKLRH